MSSLKRSRPGPAAARQPVVKPLDYKPKPKTTSRTPPAPSKPPSALRRRLLRANWIPLMLASAAGAGIPLYAIFVYRGYKNEADSIGDVPSDVSNRYNSARYAEYYDSNMDAMESVTGIKKRRKELAAQATGHVLEVSVGTGRLFDHYPLTKGIKSVTMVDKSPDMLRMARLNWAEKNGWFVRAGFFNQDGAKPVPFPKDSPEGFDTVVQTMGICSTPHPEKLLKNMGMMVKEETGRILLLEHGRGDYNWLNQFLDRIAPAHANRHGCWFNKDIGEIVRRSGLEVVQEKRFNFGTTWWYVLKRPPGFKGVDIEERKPEEPNPTKPWWAWSSWK